MQYRRVIQIILDRAELNSDQFDMEFDIEFTDNALLNHAEIKIYNMRPSRIKNIKRGTPILVNAGYQGDVGNIFFGAIYEAYTEEENVDRVTTIKAVDASDQRGTRTINKTYDAGTRNSTIIRDLVGLSGLTLGDLSLPRDVVYRQGKTVSGKLIGCIKRQAEDGGAKFHISKRRAYIRANAKGDLIRFTFNKYRGLIGSPLPFTESLEDDKELSGFEFKSLLQHRIQADSIVNIQINDVNGRYRVIDGRHYGSNFGSDFYTEMRVV